MTGTYSFKPGDWIMVEDEFAVVESIFPTYYEPFEISEEDDVKIGDYHQTVISYHVFCNVRGRVCSSKAQIKYLDFCDWIKPLTAEQTALLEQIKSKKAEAFAKWKAKCRDAKDYITIYVDTEKEQAPTALSKFRKAAKALPERFTFSDVQKILSSIPEIKEGTANTADNDQDCISFELCYMLKEQKAEHLSFYRIREFTCIEDFSSCTSFEFVFIAMYHLVRLYNQEVESEKLDALAERLKSASYALSHGELKKDSLAKDFFKHAPKILYRFDTAYSTMEAFFDRNSKELGVEDFTELVKKRDERIVEMFHQILGV